MKPLKQLPEEPVFWVVLSLSLVISPHLQRFPLWSIILLAILLLWRLLCVQYNQLTPPKWLLLIISILAALGIFLHFGTLFGKTAGSVLLSILLGVKLHESQTRRDYMLLLGLSFFIIVTNFLFSQSIPTVIFMLAIVIVLVMSMISINQHSAVIPLQEKFRLASKLLFQAMPLMLIMFVLFPRISGPLWKLPEEKPVAISGLSDSMSPGNISQLIMSNAVAFRVEFENQIPAQQLLYWRAIVLWYFDGRTWERGKTNANPYPSIYSTAPAVEYTITLQPHHKKWLYALDMPSEVPSNIIYTNNFVLRARNNIDSLFQYRLQSVLEYRIEQSLSQWERHAGLRYPYSSNPQSIAFGRKLARRFSRPEDIINHVLRFFNQQNFHYTLKPPATRGDNPVDQFLFNTRRGFCEHYASSFALLMRAAGIPARVVLGYQGGTLNPLNQVLTVRQSDAHAWNEVWLENRGWVRVDPTAAIAPERIERNLQAALEDTEARPFHLQINSGVLKKLLFYWDAMDNQWNQWVVGYNARLQRKLLDNILQDGFNMSDIILIMIISFSLTLMLIALYIIKPWQTEKQLPVVAIYNQFCKKLADQGIRRHPWEGPLDFARRAADELPQHKNTIMLISQLYIKLRYGLSPGEKLLTQFKQHTRQFRPGGR